MAKKEQTVEELEMDAENANHAETRVYELGFHIDSELPETAMKKIYQTIRDTVDSVGTFVAEGAPVKVPLAYTISRQEHAGRRDFNSSFFAWIAYEADGAGHAKVIETANAESSIFRFIDLRTTKEAVQQSEQLQEMLLKTDVSAFEDGEEVRVSDEEIDAALKEVTV